MNKDVCILYVLCATYVHMDVQRGAEAAGEENERETAAELQRKMQPTFTMPY